MTTNLYEPAVEDDTAVVFLGDVAVKQREPAKAKAARPTGRSPVVRTSLIRIRIAGSRDDAAAAGGAQDGEFPPVRRLQPSASIAGPPLYIVTAYDRGRLVGTLGVRIDSACGLSADQRFPAELAALRVRSLQLCEITDLAVEGDAPSKTVLASLFHTAYLYAHRLHGVDAAVIEVAPRHASFCIRAARFERIAEARADRRADAPTLLLHVPFERVARGIARWAGKPELAGGTRTLFPYAFSPAEEAGVLERMRRQHAAGQPQPVPVH